MIVLQNRVGRMNHLGDRLILDFQVTPVSAAPPSYGSDAY